MNLERNPKRMLRRSIAAGLFALLGTSLMAEPVAAASTLCPLPTGPVVVCVDNFGLALPIFAPIGTATSKVTVQTWRYQFPVPIGGTVVAAPCIKVLVDNSPAGPSANDLTIDPCAGAGGTGIVLLDSQGPFSVGLPAGTFVPVAYIVQAQLAVTVSGFGISGAPVLVLCLNPACNPFP